MARVKDGVSPPGGFHFFQPLSGGRKLKIVGTNFDSLVSNVLVARLENDVAPGDVRQEVETYICGLSKGQCVSPPTPSRPAPAERPAGMKDRWVDVILAWANKAALSRSGMGGLVSLQVAEERARQCASCPLNLRWQNSCPQCVLKAQQVLNRLHQGVVVKDRRIVDRIGGCRHHRWDNTAAAFMAEPESGPKEHPVNPVPGCWAERIKKE